MIRATNKMKNAFVCLTCVLLCAATNALAQQSEGRVVQEKIVYKRIDTVSLQLWKYLRDDLSEETQQPALLFFHGGGWNEGSPKRFDRLCTYFASRGMIVFSAEYRLKKTHGTTPFDATADAKDAFDYLIANAEELAIDPKLVVVGGGSAGAHLATTTGFWKNEGVKPVAFLLYSPVLDTGPDGFGFHRMEGKHLTISPIENIDELHPPTIVLLGTKDAIVPVATAKSYQKKVEAAGSVCKLILYEDQKHSFFHRQPYFNETLLQCDQFLIDLKVLSGSPTIKSSFRR